MNNGELIAFEQPNSPTAEDFRTLRTNIQFGKRNKEIKTILLTSFESGEGKSWVSSNLAVSFAQKNDRVILVDTDMRKGRVHDIFNVSEKQGLADILNPRNKATVGSQLINYVKDTEMSNLKIITIGKYPQNPTELILSKRMDDLLSEAREQSDIVIVDAPPATMVSDTLILAPKVDGIVLVVEQGKRQANEVKKVIKDIKKVGGNIIGIVFNKVPNMRKSYGRKSYGYAYTSVPTKLQKKKSYRD